MLSGPAAEPDAGPTPHFTVRGNPVPGRFNSGRGAAAGVSLNAIAYGRFAFGTASISDGRRRIQPCSGFASRLRFRHRRLDAGRTRTFLKMQFVPTLNLIKDALMSAVG